MLCRAWQKERAAARTDRKQVGYERRLWNVQLGDEEIVDA